MPIERGKGPIDVPGLEYTLTVVKPSGVLQMDVVTSLEKEMQRIGLEICGRTTVMILGQTLKKAFKVWPPEFDKEVCHGPSFIHLIRRRWYYIRGLSSSVFYFRGPLEGGYQ